MFIQFKEHVQRCYNDDLPSCSQSEIVAPKWNSSAASATTSKQQNAKQIDTRYVRTYSEEECKQHRDKLKRMLNKEGNWDEAIKYAKSLQLELDVNEPNYETSENVYVFNNLKKDPIGSVGPDSKLPGLGRVWVSQTRI